MTNRILRPLVGLPADSHPTEELLRHSIGDKYVRAVAEAANALPVVIPAIADVVGLDDLLDRLDGLVLTGATSNVDPALYGVDPTVDHEPYDRRRDALTLQLILKALERGMPLLCICRGYQELNVALGGTLDTEIHRHPGRLDHRELEGVDVATRYAPSHRITITPGGALEAILGKAATQVNSLHRQAIARLGCGVQVEAQASDGTVEAISVTYARGFAIGTQWHPEYQATQNPDSLRLFRAFGDAARTFGAAKQK